MTHDTTLVGLISHPLDLRFHHIGDTLKFQHPLHTSPIQGKLNQLKYSVHASKKGVQYQIGVLVDDSWYQFNSGEM